MLYRMSKWSIFPSKHKVKLTHPWWQCFTVDPHWNFRRHAKPNNYQQNCMLCIWISMFSNKFSIHQTWSYLALNSCSCSWSFLLLLVNSSSLVRMCFIRLPRSVRMVFSSRKCVLREVKTKQLTSLSIVNVIIKRQAVVKVGQVFQGIRF